MQAFPQYLLLLRHGLSQANLVTEVKADGHYYPLTGSDAEVGLTPLGIDQSIAAGSLIARHFPAASPIGAVYLSPFRRVRQTADEITRALGYQVTSQEDPQLAKRSYGDFWNLTYLGVRELHPEEHRRFEQQGRLAYRPPGGENYPDVFARVDSFIDRAVMPSRQHLLVVTHAVVSLAFQRRFDGLSDDEVVRRYEEVELPNCHLIAYARSAPEAPWQPHYLDAAGI